MFGGNGGNGSYGERGRGKGTYWERLLRSAGEAVRRRELRRAEARETVSSAEPRLARSPLGVAIEARVAVRSGVRLEDFLRGRLAHYAARLPVSLEALPVTIEIEGGEPVVRGRPPSRAGAAKRTAPDAAPAWLEPLVRREGPHAAREIRDAELSIAVLESRTTAARERADALERTLADDLAAGVVPSMPRIEATPEQLGRPPIPLQTSSVVLQGFVAALLGAEAWRFTGPALAASGVQADGIVEAFEVAPLPAAMGTVFALGAAVAVFAFAAFSLGRARAALADVEAPRRRAVFAAGALGAAALAAGVAVAGASSASLAHVVLLAAVPFGAALVLDHAGRLKVTRGCALDAALAWDRERAVEWAERARRVEVVERAQEELRRSADDLEEARRRLRGLEQHAVEAGKSSERLLAAEARRLERLAESLAGALELDRYVFVKLASDRAHDVLVRPVRPAPRLEPSVADRLGVAG